MFPHGRSGESASPDPAAIAAQAVDLLTEEDRQGWSGVALGNRVIELAGILERTQAALTQAVSDWDAAQGWAADGAVSPKNWLVNETPMSTGEAITLVAAARTCRGHDRIAKALAVGDISFRRAAALGRANSTARRKYFDRDADVLLDAALTLNNQNFDIAVKHWTELIDQEIEPRSAAEAHRTRGVYFQPRLGGAGGRITADLDQDGFERVMAAIESRTTPDPEGAPSGQRSLAQRRADALDELADESLRGSPEPSGRTGQPSQRPGEEQPELPAEEATKADADNSNEGEPPSGNPVPSQRGRIRRPHRRSPQAAIDLLLDIDTLHGHPDFEHIRFELRRAGPVNPQTAQRLLCDSTVGRLIMQGRSKVLDLGAHQRTVTDAQWRALVARDGGCTFPLCDRPPEWTDAHHLVPWHLSHNSDLINYALLCRLHHTLVHEGGWTLDRDPDTGLITATSPDGRVFTRA